MTLDIDRLSTALGSRYRLERELGVGGMATVYLATDLKHDRQVGLKVLRPELAAVIGAERFLAEIKVTANLQHPHILPLHDSGEADGFLFYVMPFVEGETLRDQLTREKQLGIDQAVGIATGVASALDYAHRHRVVHRDIKPENILLHDGQALVADFGIALAVSTAGGTRMTETGMSLGTPHYMSPEQAMGEREITGRSDIYALGAVLYEMLAGAPPFTGPTAQAIVAKVVTARPEPLTTQRHTVPPHVEGAVFKALEKLPADRFATAAEFASALTTPGAFVSRRLPGVGVAMPGWRAGWRVAAAVGLAALLVGVLAGRMTRRVEQPAPQVGRFVIETDSSHRLTGAPIGTVALSPDGFTLVYVGYVGRDQLYRRRLDELEAAPIPGTEGAAMPFFTPDGRWIGFFAGAGLKKVALSGGAPVAVPNVPTSVFTQWAAWLDGETLLTTAGDGSLHRVGADGTMARIAAPDSAAGETALLVTDVLPGRRIALGTASTQGGVSGRGVAIDVESGERTVIMEGPINGLAFDDGYLVWAQPDGTLLAAPFDTRRLALKGPPVTLAQGVRVSVGGPAQFYVSKNRSLVYVPELPFDLMLVDRTGRSRVIANIQRRFHSPRFSPDGRRVAMDFTQQGSRDVWSLDLRQRTLTRLTFDGDGHDPVWATDGRKIAYATARGGVIGMFERNADGSGAAESLYVGESVITAGAFDGDGQAIVTIALGSDGSWDLGLLSLAGERVPKPLLKSPFNEAWPAVSPDGRWLAYTSDESGQSEVYVRPFPGPGAKILVSQNGGSEPVWSRSGRELFYRGSAPQGSQLVAVGVETKPQFRAVSRTPLFDMSEYEPAAPHANYDVDPDGNFVMVHQGGLSRMVLIQNWTEEVRRRSAGSER